MPNFNQWWNDKGFDVASEETPLPEMQHKMALSALAFQAGKAHGLAISSNYTADKEQEPTEVTFYNGRRVLIAKDHAEGAAATPFLIVLQEDVSPLSQI